MLPLDKPTIETIAMAKLSIC